MYGTRESIYLYGMLRPAFSLVLLITLVFSRLGHAQEAASMTANELAAVAVDHLKAVAKEATHYASTSDFESDTYDAADKRISRFTDHAEFVALKGGAYERAAISREIGFCASTASIFSATISVLQ
jgi:hypothetical protein